MQLVANGAQDVYLTENPTITYWKRAYQRHTNFSCEAIEQTFNGPLDFSKRVTCTISRNGDLINNTYLEVELPAVPAGLSPSDVWVDYIGHALINSIEITIGGQTIDKHYGDWLHIWYQLSNKNKEGYEKMIGARVTEDQQTLYIPLQFWWNRSPGMALPLIALQYHEVKITITFNDRRSCIKKRVWDQCNSLSISKAALYVDFIYIDSEERRRFAQVSHEYLIQQLQFTGEESVTGNQPKKINIAFNHPCKELVWVIQPDANNNKNPTFAEEPRLFDYSATSEHSSPVDADYGEINLEDESGLVLEGDGAGIVRQGRCGTIKTAKIQLNGHDRISERPGSYFNLVQPYQHHTNVPKDGIYCYSFALEPESDQPSGSCNMSRIDIATLVLNMNSFHPENENGKIRVYATNFNVLRVMGGMGGLAFAN
jgi:hypothetical protein